MSLLPRQLRPVSTMLAQILLSQKIRGRPCGPDRGWRKLRDSSLPALHSAEDEVGEKPAAVARRHLTTISPAADLSTYESNFAANRAKYDRNLSLVFS